MKIQALGLVIKMDGRQATKQVIVVRTDLKMKKGKIAAQVAHASLLSYLDTRLEQKFCWLQDSYTKVVLKVSSEKELYVLQREAKKLGVSNFLVRDAGRTQVDPGSLTCLGIGPDYETMIDKVTAGLKLL